MQTSASKPDSGAHAAQPLPEDKCVSIIGMAAAGKSKMGAELARLMDWAHVDSDHLIESAYGAPLQHITDAMSKEEFLDLEAKVIQNIRLAHCVISTGGSVVYREQAMLRLKELGPVLYIDVPLPIILERIARKPDRGLAIAPGQTIEDLFNERKLLYEKYADLRIAGGNNPVTDYALEALEAVRGFFRQT